MAILCLAGKKKKPVSKLKLMSPGFSSARRRRRWDGDGIFLLIEAVLLNIPDHVIRREVVDAHLPPQEQPDLGTRDLIRDHLGDVVDLVLPLLEAGQRLVDVGACPLNDEDTEVAQDVLEVAGAPDAGLGHARNSNSQRQRYRI